MSDEIVQTKHFYITINASMADEIAESPKKKENYLPFNKVKQWINNLLMLRHVEIFTILHNMENM